MDIKRAVMIIKKELAPYMTDQLQDALLVIEDADIENQTLKAEKESLIKRNGEILQEMRELGGMEDETRL